MLHYLCVSAGLVVFMKASSIGVCRVMVCRTCYCVRLLVRNRSTKTYIRNINIKYKLTSLGLQWIFLQAKLKSCSLSCIYNFIYFKSLWRKQQNCMHVSHIIRKSMKRLGRKPPVCVTRVVSVAVRGFLFTPWNAPPGDPRPPSVSFPGSSLQARGGRVPLHVSPEMSHHLKHAHVCFHTAPWLPPRSGNLLLHLHRLPRRARAQERRVGGARVCEHARVCM